MRICTYCGLSGHNTPACPLKKTFITDDIWAIFHTDPNPTQSFFDLTYEGEIIVPDTFFSTLQKSSTSPDIITHLSNDDENQCEDVVPALQSQEEMVIGTTPSTDNETRTSMQIKYAHQSQENFYK
eukprot:TRINITY_DN6924_c0_g2_i10.p1 TRINITY_DN6924_c0_g2~~TRINITY_DN6924_c0_g2_i10.p1  ORF type:complete len:126 (-),score=20.27 TRINITY_DN6924_c0_g2_i10:221-598(-)